MNIVSQRWGESSRVRWHICFQHFLFLQKFRFSSKFLLFLKVSFFFHCLNFRGWLLPCHLLHLLLPCPEPRLEISTNFTSYYISHFTFYSILSLNYFHHSNLSHFKFYNFKSILFLTHLTSYYKSRFIFLHFFEPTSQEFHLGSISMKMCQIWCFLCNEQMWLHRLTFVLKIMLCLGKDAWNILILFLPGVESGIAIGDTYPVPPCFTDLTKKW